MVITNDLAPSIRKIVTRLLTATLSDAVIREIGKQLCQITGMRYFALLLFLKKPKPLRSSGDDNHESRDTGLCAGFRMTGRPRRDPVAYSPRKKYAVEKFCCFPLRIDQYMRAVCVFGQPVLPHRIRRYLGIGIVRFVVPFFSEAIARSVSPPHRTGRSVFFVSARNAPRADNVVRGQKPNAHFSFTSRELEVVASICSGLSNKQIAANLGIEEATVKRHAHNIFMKTGFRSRVELVLGLS